MQDNLLKKTLTILLGIGIIGLGFYSIYFLQHLVIILLISGFAAVLIDPLVERIQTFKIKGKMFISEGFAISLSVLLILSFVGIFFSLVLPIIVEQLMLIFKNMSSYINLLISNIESGQLVIPYVGKEQLITQIESIKSLLNVNDILNVVFNNSGVVLDGVKGGMNGVVKTGALIVGNIMSFIGDIFLILFFVVFILHEKREIKKYLLSFFGEKKKTYIHTKLNKINHILGWWITGQFKLILIMLSLTFLGLLIIGLGNTALTLALISGVGFLIPYVGPLVFLVTAGLISLNVSIFMFMKVLIMYGILQLIEGYIITPAVVKEHLNLGHVILAIALIIGFNVGGILGAIIAIPAVKVLDLLLDDFKKDGQI